jgi:hypothetical protein
LPRPPASTLPPTPPLPLAAPKIDTQSLFLDVGRDARQGPEKEIRCDKLLETQIVSSAFQPSPTSAPWSCPALALTAPAPAPSCLPRHLPLWLWSIVGFSLPLLSLGFICLCGPPPLPDPLLCLGSRPELRSPCWVPWLCPPPPCCALTPPRHPTWPELGCWFSAPWPWPTEAGFWTPSPLAPPSSFRRASHSENHIPDILPHSSKRHPSWSKSQAVRSACPP